MSFWNRLFGKKKAAAPAPEPLRDIPAGAMTSAQTLICDPTASDPERRFSVGKWGLRVAGDEESQRYARGVLKRSAGKSLRLEPHPEAGHRGVISTASQDAHTGGGYKWIHVDVDLRAGTIRFRQGGTTDLPTP